MIKGFIKEFVEGVGYGIVLCTLIAGILVLLGKLICTWPVC